MRFSSRSPFFPRTPWFHMPGNSPGDSDVRTGPLGVGVGDIVSSDHFAPRVAPNPCVDGASISFSLPSVGVARVHVYDVAGRRVATLADGVHPGGAHTLSWDTRDDLGRRVASGVYMIRFEHEATRATSKLIIRR